MSPLPTPPSLPPSYVLEATRDITHWMKRNGIDNIVIVDEGFVLVPTSGNTRKNLIKTLRQVWRLLSKSFRTF